MSSDRSPQDLYGPKFQRSAEPGSARSARVVVPLVVDLLDPSSVVDVGCGTGVWLAEFKRHGVSDVVGVDTDRDAASLQVAPDEFLARDLSQPLDFERRFDLAVSLEVAEHLPERSAPAFVAQLTSLAPSVLFAAAVPHQGGTGHVNEQWPEYWARLFADQGYAAVDCVRPQIWSHPEVEFWYAQNTLLYVAPELLAGNQQLAVAATATRADALSLVHPALYTAKVRQPELSVGGVAAAVAAALRRVACAARGRLRG